MQGVLTYHSVDDSGSVVPLAPAQFRRHAEWLARSALLVRPLAQLVSTANGCRVSMRGTTASSRSWSRGGARRFSVG